eukprot:TRINITY_DN3594_c0_g1_i2.p1 TRINITY_DN3594_c0_g1~~TRINITY_DN3594_c0_g1_i2.p1  ORF type:complete len:385 (+),score=20.05 TRINITY_DN3594_c0_g1_i2:1656-2810(+)
MLRNWKNNNFEHIVDEHNFLWNYIEDDYSLAKTVDKDSIKRKVILNNIIEFCEVNYQISYFILVYFFQNSMGEQIILNGGIEVRQQFVQNRATSHKQVKWLSNSIHTHNILCNYFNYCIFFTQFYAIILRQLNQRGIIMKSNLKRAFSISLLIAVATVVSSTSLPVTAHASTQNSHSVVSSQNSSTNILKELSKLNSVSFEQKNATTKTRSIKLDNGIVLNEELTYSDSNLTNTNTKNTLSSSLSATSVSRQVKSTVTIKNNIGLTGAVLTAYGYFTHNGSTCYATSGDSSSSAGTLYTASDYVSYVGYTPVSGYARVTCKYHISGSINLLWGNVSVSDLNVTGNVFCNQDGKYYSEWSQLQFLKQFFFKNLATNTKTQMLTIP